MTETLIDLIKQYSDVPGESGNERMIRPVIMANMRGHFDRVWKDEKGNMYFLRKGMKPGRVMLCAHQDKVVGSNARINLSRERNGEYSVDNSKACLGYLLGLMKKGTEQDNFLYEKEFIPVGFRFKNRDGLLDLRQQVIQLYDQCDKEFEELSKQKVADKTSSVSSYGIVGIKMSDVPSHGEFERKLEELRKGMYENTVALPPADSPKKMTVQIWPKFEVSEEGIIRGKLDDTLGLGIITRVNQTLPREDSPDLLTVFTVEEEIGCKGADFAVKYLKLPEFLPDRCIVIDTTRFGELGEGAIIYKKCGSTTFDERFVKDLESIAETRGIKYKSVEPFTNNDSSALARGLETVATIAIEVPITGMHSALETAHREDVVATYKLVCDYITQGNIQPLEGVDHSWKIIKWTGLGKWGDDYVEY